MRITSVHEEGTIKIPVIELDNEEKKTIQTQLTNLSDKRHGQRER